MRPLEIKFLKLLGFTLFLAVVASIVFPILASAGPRSKGSICLSHLKQQAIGMLMYADGHDGRFALRDRWMDDIGLVLKSEEIFHEPLESSNEYGYAFNAALGHAKVPPNPETWPLVYDSTNLQRNATDPVTSLPHPGRHHGRNAVAYADGHARLRSPDQMTR